MTPPRATFDGPALAAPDPTAARLLREKLEHNEPGTLATYGISDASLEEPGKTLEQAVEGGWIEAAEMRAIQGTASKEDLSQLGYTRPRSTRCSRRDHVIPATRYGAR